MRKALFTGTFDPYTIGHDSIVHSDLSFMDENKVAFSEKLKECGFLRDLSDATSIVENPYDKED